jgi:hypothetical protein
VNVFIDDSAEFALLKIGVPYYSALFHDYSAVPYSKAN